MNTQPQRGNTEAAAHHAGLSISTMNKYRVYGTGPRFYKVGRRVVYDLADVDAWLAERVRTSTSEYSN